MEVGDYIFSIPRLSGWNDTPKPMRTAEVMAVTKTRAKLDNGVTVMRPANGGGQYGNWVSPYGFCNEEYDFSHGSSVTMVWVRRDRFSYFASYWSRRREIEQRNIQITNAVMDAIRDTKTVEELDNLGSGLLARLESCLPLTQ